MNPTPISLLDRLRREPDGLSWRRLFDLYTPLMRHCLKRQGVVSSDEDDLLQDVCATIARELPRFEHDGRAGAFRHWVRTIVVNRLRGYWRARRTARAATVLHDLDELVDPDSPLSRRWDHEHDEFIARRLLELIEPEFTPTTWKAFRRQVIDGACATEVAGDLGVSVNAVLVAKSRVLRRLREEGRGLIESLG